MVLKRYFSLRKVFWNVRYETTATLLIATALCNTIERDLREMLGEKDLPPKAAPMDGFLY